MSKYQVVEGKTYNRLPYPPSWFKQMLIAMSMDIIDSSDYILWRSHDLSREAAVLGVIKSSKELLKLIPDTKVAA